MYEQFEQWLEDTLKESLPEETVAISFNLYEEEENQWSMELVATASFDEDDEDWACDEVYSNGEEPFAWEEEADWESVQEKMESMMKEYLNHGEYADILKKYDGIGMGFVDGDMNILYKR